jgi:site-specific DNA-methyltransferase (adenine-specific)
MTDTNQASEVLQGDCLELMKDIPDGSVDMILADLPYGTTACKWDTIIPFEPLWEQYKRIIKPNGAIVLTASQPFTSALVMSNPKMFKYCWYWEKEKGTGFQNSRHMPLRLYEEVLVFYSKKPLYTPPREKLDKPYYRSFGDANTKSLSNRMTSQGYVGKTVYYEYKTPTNRLRYARDNANNGVHPTQKPVALFEYLIKTYTNEGDLVLDNVAGSGTTGVAAMNTNRNFILMEQEPEYVEIIKQRLKDNAKELL